MTSLESPEQQTEATRILDVMVARVKESVKGRILLAAVDLERIGIPVDRICHMITQRAEEMKISEPYVRECLPSKYKDQAQREVRLGKNYEGEVSSSPAVTPKKKDIKVTKKQDIKLLREEVKELRKENEDLKKSQVQEPIQTTRTGTTTPTTKQADNKYKDKDKIIADLKKENEIIKFDNAILKQQVDIINEMTRTDKTFAKLIQDKVDVEVKRQKSKNYREPKKMTALQQYVQNMLFNERMGPTLNKMMDAVL